MKHVLWFVLLLVPALAFGQGFTKTINIFPNCGTIDSLYIRAASDTIYGGTLIVDSCFVQYNNDTIRVHPGTTPYNGAKRVAFAGVKSTAAAMYGAMQIHNDVYGLKGAWVIYNSADSILRVSKTPTGVATKGDTLVTLVFRKPEFPERFGEKWGGRIASTFYPPGTEVVKWIDSCSMKLNERPYVDTGVVTLSTNVVAEFPFYGGSASAMAAGDIVGMPFQIDIPTTSYLALSHIMSIDSTRQTGTFSVILLDSAFEYIAQNGPWVINPTSQRHIVAVAPVSTTVNIGNALPGGTIYLSTTQYEIVRSSGWLRTRNKLYGVMMTTGTPTYQGTNSLTLKLYFDTTPH